jgi:hypothetical protein
MKDNRLVTIIAFLTIAFTGAILLSFQDRTSILNKKNPAPTSSQKEIHYHAGFRIYVDGELQNFTKLDYMSIKPCAVDEDEKHEETEEDMLHLHDGVGDVVHIHGPNRKWKHLFAYLKLNPEESVTAYNGAAAVEKPLESPITAYQSMTFFVGDEPGNKDQILAAPISKEYIKKMEKKSENCGN